MIRSVALCATIALWTLPAVAQSSGFHCPKAGTIAAYGVFKVRYLGADPNDPYLCKRVNAAGKTETLLFNFLLTDQQSIPTVQAAMAPLFTGTSPISYSYVAASNLLHYKDTWRSVKTEKVEIAHRLIEAEVFERHQQGQKNNSYDGKTYWWFDPLTGLWLKQQTALVAPPTGTVQSITEPKS